MIIKLAIVLAMLMIVASLGSGLVYLVRDKENDSRKLAIALTWRISLSLLLFCFLFYAYSQGWIQPHGIGR